MAWMLAAPTAAVAPEPAQVIPEWAFHRVEVPAAIPVVVDAFPGPTRAPRPVVVVPVAPVIVVAPPPTSGPKSYSGPSGGHLAGLASWYCRAGVSVCHYQYPDTGGFDAYAAAGPRLRAALGSGWRGTVVSVNGVRVKLVDWCQCYKGEPHEKIIDLYYDVFARTGGNVTIRW